METTTVTGTKRGGRKPRPPLEAKTRRDILAAALGEFSERGIAGARMDVIARAAGVSPALIYYYFKDKDGLYYGALEETFRSFVEQLRRNAERGTDVTQMLGTLIFQLFDILRDNPAFPRIILRECADGGKVLREIKRRNPDWFGSNARLVTERVQAAVDAGLIRPVPPAQIVATAGGMFFLLFGAHPILDLFFPPDQLALDDLEKWRDLFIDFFVHAIRP